MCQRDFSNEGSQQNGGSCHQQNQRYRLGQRICVGYKQPPSRNAQCGEDNEGQLMQQHAARISPQVSGGFTMVIHDIRSRHQLILNANSHRDGRRNQ